MGKQLIGVRASRDSWLRFQKKQLWSAPHVIKGSPAGLTVASRDRSIETEYRWLASEDQARGIRWTEIINLSEDSFVDYQDNTQALKAFFMIYGEHGAAPCAKHATYAAASEEADRLAAKHPGRVFFILRAVEGRLVDVPRPRQVILS